MRKSAFTIILVGGIFVFTGIAAAAERHVPSEYATIQAAINACNNGDVVVVAPGVYTGAGNRDIDFMGKDITVKSENGPKNCIIHCQGDANSPHRGFYFHGGETSSSVLGGLTITGGYVFDCGGPDYGGAGIFCSNSSPTIINCIIKGNHTELIPGCLGFCYGGGIKIWGSSSPTFTNCIISNNSTGICGNGGGISISGSSNSTFTNCIINNNSVGNNGTGGGVCDDAGATFLNCIISGNSAIGVLSSCGGIACSGGAITNCIIWDNYNGQIGGYLPTVTFSNIEGGYTGTGNINVNPYFANPGNGDYHLKSQAGRWNPTSQSWVKDAVTSPCIDAGDPNSDWTEELWPHGKRINMGAYGGTSQASMSLSTVGNIANLNNDPCDIIDFNDLVLFVGKWLYQEVLLPEDLDRNRIVNFDDYAIFAQQWLGVPVGEPGIEYEISPCGGMGMDLSATEQLDETRFTVTVEGRYIHFEDMMRANCCAKELWLEMTVEDNLITVCENDWGGLCLCICDYPVTATLGPFEPGTYTLEVYNGGFIGSTTVIIK
jgi:hypothetical protein